MASKHGHHEAEGWLAVVVLRAIGALPWRGPACAALLLAWIGT